tara:strand:- start:116 stop:520 length:405 start_codon:yes stop_codon:yes gene_type:complete
MENDRRPADLRETQKPFEFDTIQGLYEVRSPPGMPADKTYIAYELRGFPMRPARDRWVLYFLKPNVVDLAALLDEPCVVHLKDGRTMFRVIRQGYQDGLFNLESWDGSDLEANVEIEQAFLYVGQARPEMAQPD